MSLVYSNAFYKTIAYFVIRIGIVKLIKIEFGHTPSE
jgi:hypothetical protein